MNTYEEKQARRREYYEAKAAAAKEVIKMIKLNNEAVDFEVAVNLMDDEIREAVHADIAPCTDQEFIDEYVKRHEEKYGEEFKVN